MKIIGIHDGHNASCCYLENGEIKSAALEERFCQRKNHSGYPKRAVEWILEENGLTFEDVDCVAFPHVIRPVVFNDGTLKQYTPLRVLHSIACEVLPRRIIGASGLVGPYIKLVGPFRRRTLKEYAVAQGIPVKKIFQAEHHTAHTYAALYSSGFMEKGVPLIAFTMDNSGDGLSSTVSTWEPGVGVKRVHTNQSFHSMGELYSRVTEYLGMKMAEHEHKIMGMAPYAAGDHAERTYDVLKRYIRLDRSGLGFENMRTYGYGLLYRMKHDLFQHRFDSICSAIQRLLEDLVVPWVRNWCSRTGIRRAVFGGGIFMNVKLNLLLTKIPELDLVYFTPSSSDESTAIGAAYYANEIMGGSRCPSFGTPYKGPEYRGNDIKRSLKRYSDKIVCRREGDIERTLAELIAKGRIVGRFQGRSEWGARALGNRSICCRADDLRVVARLNKAIKRRDFWMPFAPSVLEDDAQRYIINEKNISAPYMMLAFESTPLAQKHIIAALHPYDKSCRPQIVHKEWNPRYHRLLTIFREISGIGAILNTSFNLHGLPIVHTPDDAIRTLLKSNLHCVAIEDYMIQAKPGIQPAE